MYCNIGSAKRLDFTVIGPVVNIASSLESLTKTINRPILLSADLVEMVGRSSELVDLGFHKLRGLDRYVQVFSCSDPEPT